MFYQKTVVGLKKIEKKVNYKIKKIEKKVNYKILIFEN